MQGVGMSCTRVAKSRGGPTAALDTCNYVAMIYKYVQLCITSPRAIAPEAAGISHSSVCLSANLLGKFSTKMVSQSRHVVTVPSDAVGEFACSDPNIARVRCLIMSGNIFLTTHRPAGPKSLQNIGNRTKLQIYQVATYTTFKVAKLFNGSIWVRLESNVYGYIRAYVAF